jgi:hypothetical protein
MVRKSGTNFKDFTLVTQWHDQRMQTIACCAYKLGFNPLKLGIYQV